MRSTTLAPPVTTPAIALRDVRKEYGESVALDGVSLEIHAGEVARHRSAIPIERPRVAERVGERLLGDAVERRLYAARDRPRGVRIRP